MRDHYNREINYLRLSVTRSCMLRCRYCDPCGVNNALPDDEELSLAEILRIVSCCAQAGIRYVRLTGGEPLLRSDLPAIIKGIKAITGIEEVSLTTNGLLLSDLLPDLIEAGLNSVNVSLDTVDPKVYKAITGCDGLERVLTGIRSCIEGGLQVKVNAVSLSDNILSYKEIIDYFSTLPVDVRFIELMPIGSGRFETGLSHSVLLDALHSLYPDMKEDLRGRGHGPAVYYRIPQMEGRLGLISAESSRFCSNCNRIRITADGFLKPCLCYDKGYDLRSCLSSNDDDLIMVIKEQIAGKPAAHCFDEPCLVTEKKSMVNIGG